MESFGDIEAFGAIDTISNFFSPPFFKVDFFGFHEGAIGIVAELRVEF
jgi:hypothetical protein